jgi:hypothetical protein
MRIMKNEKGKLESKTYLLNLLDFETEAFVLRYLPKSFVQRREINQ